MKLSVAGWDDLRKFEMLWEEYLEENHKAGDIMLPTKANLKSFRQIASAYVESPELGFVLLAEEKKIPVGVLMWGALPSLGFETTLGKTANGWGTYVRPEWRGKGLSSELREQARVLLKAIGINTLMGSVLPGNLPAEGSVDSLGFERGAQVVIWRL